RAACTAVTGQCARWRAATLRCRPRWSTRSSRWVSTHWRSRASSVGPPRSSIAWRPPRATEPFRGTERTMKLIRFGEPGSERPGLLSSDGARVDASGFGEDYGEAFFAADGLQRLER